MIVDFGCTFKDCTAPVEFIKGQIYKSSEGSSTIYFFRCLNQHAFKKDRREVGTIQNDVEISSIDNDPEVIEYIQDELPFD